MFFSTTDLCLDRNRLSCEKNRTHMPNASRSYGRLAHEIQMDFKIFKILHRLNY